MRRKALTLQGLWIVGGTKTENTGHNISCFLCVLYLHTLKRTPPPKTTVFKIVSKPGPPSIWRTLFRLAQSKAHEDLRGRHFNHHRKRIWIVGSVGTPLGRSKCWAAQLCPPLLLWSVQRIAQDEKTASHTLIHKAFTPPWAQWRPFLTNKITMQLFL
jgi:hypothetical protein